MGKPASFFVDPKGQKGELVVQVQGKHNYKFLLLSLIHCYHQLFINLKKKFFFTFYYFLCNANTMEVIKKKWVCRNNISSTVVDFQTFINSRSYRSR